MQNLLFQPNLALKQIFEFLDTKSAINYCYSCKSILHIMIHNSMYKQNFKICKSYKQIIQNLNVVHGNEQVLNKIVYNHNLICFDCINVGITSFTIFSTCINLRKLVISINNLIDLNALIPLINCKQLNHIELTNHTSKVLNLLHLLHCKKLKTLKCIGLYLDIGDEVTKLEELENLCLDCHSFKNESRFTKLKNLKSVNTKFDHTFDFSQLIHMSKLETLNIKFAPIHNNMIHALQSNSIQTLIIENFELMNGTFLSKLPKLTHVHKLNLTIFNDWSIFKTLKLHTLDCKLYGNDQMNSIWSCYSLRKIVFEYIDQCYLKGIHKLTNLSSLFLQFNSNVKYVCFDDLCDMVQLQEFGIYGNSLEIESLDFMSNWQCIQVIHLKCKIVRNTDIIFKLSTIKYIYQN